MKSFMENAKTKTIKEWESMITPIATGRRKHPTNKDVPTGSWSLIKTMDKKLGHKKYCKSAA